MVSQSPSDLYNAAEQAFSRDELGSALEFVIKAEKRLGDRLDAVWSLKFHLLKAEILLAQAQGAEARKILENLPASLPSELQARALTDQAELQMQSRRLDEARALLARAREAASRTGARGVLASIELKHGLLLSDFNEADAAFHRALEIARSEQDEYRAAQALGDIGYIRLVHFRYDEAVPWFEAADQAAQKIPSKIIHEELLGNIGWCYFRLGELDHALDLFTRAETIASEGHTVDDQQQWLGNIGSVYYAREDYEEAISYYAKALAIAQKPANTRNAVWWLNNIDRVYIDQSKWDEAESFNRQARDAEASAPNPDSAAYTQLNTGLIATARGRTNEAESAFHTAIQLAARTHQPNVEWQAHSGLAELYGPKDRAQAQAEYAATLGVLDREWLALSREDSKITFRNFQTSFYQDYVAFLSEEGHKEEALEIAESSRARLLMQKLDGRTSRLPVFRVADALRVARESGSVLLSYWLAPKRSYLWAITAKGVSQFALPEESAVNALIERHRKAVEDLRDPLEAGDAARQLYKILLGPVEATLRTSARVIISPDGRLHEINFETLVVDGPKPHYLIDDAMVALVPSLGVLQSAAMHQASRRPRLLMIGDPLPADPEYPPLPHLQTEVAAIAADFAATDREVYTGADAYAERFRQTAPQNFTAIHFAAHAAANEASPLNSAIILSPHGGKYKLYASEVSGLHLNPELVTLSACRSAGSKAYSGEGLMGFAWAFLDAGAQNVVAGIWNVDDATAPILMKEFYKEWRQDADPVAALRNAKRELMLRGGAFRKPYYWGPFEIFTRQATRSAMDLAWRKSSK